MKKESLPTGSSFPGGSKGAKDDGSKEQKLLVPRHNISTAEENLDNTFIFRHENSWFSFL